MWNSENSEGVAFILEELALAADVAAVKYLWENSCSNFREELIEIMTKNNSEIFRDTVKPIIKQCGKDWNIDN